MPEDVTTYEMETQMWVSDDKEIEIKAGCGVRVRIMNTSVDSTDIKAIGECVCMCVNVYGCVWMCVCVNVYV